MKHEDLGHIIDPFSPSPPPAYGNNNKTFEGVLSNDEQAHPCLVCVSPVGFCYYSRASGLFKSDLITSAAREVNLWRPPFRALSVTLSCQVQGTAESWRGKNHASPPGTQGGERASPALCDQGLSELAPVHLSRLGFVPRQHRPRSQLQSLIGCPVPCSRQASPPLGGLP